MKILDLILEESKKEFDESEVFFANEKTISINIFNKKVDKFSISESGGINLRGEIDGKTGSSYSEKLDEDSIGFLVEGAKNNLKYSESVYREEIQKPKELSVADKKESKLSQYSTDEKIDFLLDFERVIEGKSEFIDKVMIYYTEIESEQSMKNTHGIELEDKTDIAMLYIHTIVRKGEDVRTAGIPRIIHDLDIDKDKMAEELVSQAVEKFGAKSYKSGRRNIVLNSRAFIGLFSTFLSNFSAYNIAKDLSLLKGKIGEEIASPVFTLANNPFYKDGIVRTFDDEGNPTKEYNIIDKGKLTTYFYNSKMALNDKVKSTGNGFRGSYKGDIDISNSNLVVEEGKKSLEELFKDLEDGLYVTDLMGLHAGVNPISGDFSLAAEGFLVKNGKKDRPIEQITVAGNFYSLLKDIEELANDTCVEFVGSGVFASPSILVKNVDVAGSEL